MMKIKHINKFLTGIFFVSTISIGGYLIYNFTKTNNVEIKYENNNNEKYKQPELNKYEYYKFIKYNDKKYIFELENFEFYIIKKIYSIYPELVDKKIVFETNDKDSPTSVNIIISTWYEILWNYSII